MLPLDSDSGYRFSASVKPDYRTAIAPGERDYPRLGLLLEERSARTPYRSQRAGKCLEPCLRRAYAMQSSLVGAQKMTPAIESETIVEYEFRCFCGAPIVTTEKKVTCANCGKELGIRRSRRQHWKIAPPQRPHRKLQVEDLGVLMNRIVPYLLLGILLALRVLLGTVPVRTW